MRCWRDPSSGKNKKIRIIVIICRKAKKAGKKYTHRLLPDFLFPRKVIRSDLTLEAMELAGEPRCFEKACSVLGCVDIRTARKYLKLGCQRVKTASITLASILSRFPGNPGGGERSFPPDTHFLSSFRLLVDSYNRLQVYLHGSRGSLFKRQVFAFLSLHETENKPTTYVSDSVSAPDTT